MSVILFRIAKASRAERQVIEAMRTLHANAELRAALPQGAKTALRALVKKAAQRDYAIWLPSAAYASCDELKLVGWLALFQRERPDILPLIDEELADLLTNAASALKSACLLPYPAVLRAGIITTEPVFSAYGQGMPFRKPGDRVARPLSGRARAVAFARERGRVSLRDICKATGLSRRYVNTLYQAGDLTRVGHGYYAVATATG